MIKNVKGCSKIRISILCLLSFIILYVFFKQERSCNINETILSANFDLKTLWKTQSRRELIKSYSRYTDEVIKHLREMSIQQLAFDNPQLINLAKKLIDPPSESKLIKFSRYLMKTPQAGAIDEQLKMKRNGFFVECGALDGERSSNSLFFEKERGWTGLLIEMDPFFYLQLIGKNRRAFSINACLSPYPYVTLVKYEEDEGGRGKIVPNTKDQLPDSNLSTVIPCIPLKTLLLAINVSHVHYFSLDVEGFELPILETIIPDNNYRIDTLSVEYGHGNKEKYKKFMEKNDYKIIKDINYAKPEYSLYVVDFIFEKNNLRK